ncbi:hypothetical protein LCGC14_0455040 [marine sediment metagenome]|uniref:Uncharacterized protein n=1 Tax=marine sediment metagenome TaxID=412755 RepID=A0A0F9SGM8_9ZZZZ
MEIEHTSPQTTPGRTVYFLTKEEVVEAITLWLHMAGQALPEGERTIKYQDDDYRTARPRPAIVMTVTHG